MLVDEAVRRYLVDDSVFVITPRRDGVFLSAAALNTLIRDELNPPVRQGLKVLRLGGLVLRDGDRVAITTNDAARGCFNGDVGTLRIRQESEPVRSNIYDVLFPDGRRASWTAEELRKANYPLSLSYAMTVHKAQGSGCNTVLIPLPENQMRNMLNRRLFYTAISRAKRRVILFASPDAVELAIRESPRCRNSDLVAKTRELLLRDRIA